MKNINIKLASNNIRRLVCFNVAEGLKKHGISRSLDMPTLAVDPIVSMDLLTDMLRGVWRPVAIEARGLVVTTVRRRLNLK